MCTICFPLQNNARHCAPVNMYLLGAFQVSTSQSKEGIKIAFEIAWKLFEKTIPISVHCTQYWNSKTWWTLRSNQCSAHTFWWNSGPRTSPYFLTEFGLSRNRGNLPLQEVVNRTKVRSPRNTTNVSVYGPLCVSADRSWAGRWCGCSGGCVTEHLLAPMCPVYLTIHTLKTESVKPTCPVHLFYSLWDSHW